MLHEHLHWCLVLQTDKQAKALFQVFVSFELKGLAFNPDETAILEEINANTLEGIISVAQVSCVRHTLQSCVMNNAAV